MLDDLIRLRLEVLAKEDKLDMTCPRVLAKLEARRLQIQDLATELIKKQTQKL